MRALIALAVIAVCCVSALPIHVVPSPAHHSGGGNSGGRTGPAKILEKVIDAYTKLDLTALGNCFTEDAKFTSPTVFGDSVEHSKSDFLGIMGMVFGEMELPVKYIADFEKAVFTETTFAAVIKGAGFANQSMTGTYAWSLEGFALAKINSNGTQIERYGWFQNPSDGRPQQANATAMATQTVQMYKDYILNNQTAYLSNFNSHFVGFVHVKGVGPLPQFNYSYLANSVVENEKTYVNPIVINVDNNLVVAGRFVAVNAQLWLKRKTPSQHGAPNKIFINAFHLWVYDSNSQIVFGDIFDEQFFHLPKP